MTLQKVMILFGILLVIIVGFVFGQTYLKTHSLPFLNTQTVSINKHLFHVTVAKTEKEKEIGLSEKTTLLPDQGMLFVFDTPDTYRFWMKDMKFPIDIIYIRSNHIVSIKSNIQPPKDQNENIPIYTPDQSADSVLEINAGLSDKYGFKNNDEVKITR